MVVVGDELSTTAHNDKAIVFAREGDLAIQRGRTRADVQLFIGFDIGEAVGTRLNL